jgi:hypothetical protein
MKPLNMRSSEAKVRLLYILAASHSGSTLTAMLLNAHPEVCSVGELKATSLGDVDRYRCSCRKMILECPFWIRVTEEMGLQGFDFSIAKGGTDFRCGANPYVLKLLQPLYRGGVLESVRDAMLLMSPRWRAQVQRIQDTNWALMSNVLLLTRKTVVVDSSKIGIRLKLLMKNPRLDIKILRVLRDGRAVSLTHTDPANFADAQRADLRGGGQGGVRDSERLSMEHAAREWRRSNEEADALLKGVNRSQWMEIRYEDLCRRPEMTLAEIFQFVGVDRSRVNLEFRSVEHHVIGNGMRLDSNSQILVDDRWRTHLTAAQIEAFNRIAGPLNKSLGYN